MQGAGNSSYDNSQGSSLNNGGGNMQKTKNHPAKNYLWQRQEWRKWVAVGTYSGSGWGHQKQWLQGWPTTVMNMAKAKSRQLHRKQATKTISLQRSGLGWKWVSSGNFWWQWMTAMVSIAVALTMATVNGTAKTTATSIKTTISMQKMVTAKTTAGMWRCPDLGGNSSSGWVRKRWWLQRWLRHWLQEWRQLTSATDAIM